MSITIRKILSCAPVLVAFAQLACGGGSDGNSPNVGGVSTSGAAAKGGAGGASGGTATNGGTSPGGVMNGGNAGATQGGATGGTAPGGSAGATGGSGGSAGNGGAGGSSTIDPAVKVVMYLPNWAGSFASWAGKIDFNKMTHLDLAFGTIKAGTNDWSLGAPDDDVKAIAKTAHDAHVKVLVSIGGADDDIGIINRYATAANIQPMVDNLDAFITRLDLDGVDVDLERGSGLKVSTNFPDFLAKLIAKLRPQGKVVSTALAQYIIEDTGDDASKTAPWLTSYDFINLMIYNKNIDVYTKELNWWTTQRNIPKSKLTWGVDFTGATNADTIKALTIASKAYGGVMAWELSQDAAPPLWKAVQDSL
jgi:chitinase